MKQTLLVSFALIAIAFLAPLLASGGEPLIGGLPSASPALPGESVLAPSASPGTSVTGTPQGTIATPPPVPAIPPKPERYTSDKDTALTLLRGGQAVSMTLRELLLGILTSEMPYAYPDEALKAQAVAARGFALYCMEQGARHPGADLCADPGCCLAYAPIGELSAAWGADGEAYAERVAALVDATDGQVLYYDGALCQTAFFSVSSGRTENAADVWGGALPYLTAVDSAWDASSEKYAATLGFGAAEARTLLLGAWPSMALDGTPDSWFGPIKRSTAGGVLYAEIGGVSVSGTDVRAVFGLASHNFTLSASAEELRFDTRGHGHGVGMSQYGAGEMAKNGADYAAILAHYYQGTALSYRQTEVEDTSET